jgi:glycosyltransferase involved in cell wall biosynthesis
MGLSPVPRNALTEVGSPTKAVEYLACGLPVVCNDQPDQAAVVRDSGNGRITSFSADGFADAIVDVLRASETDRGRADAKRKAAHARQWVLQHRSYEVIGSGVAQQLRQVVSSARDARVEGTLVKR